MGKVGPGRDDGIGVEALVRGFAASTDNGYIGIFNEFFGLFENGIGWRWFGLVLGSFVSANDGTLGQSHVFGPFGEFGFGGSSFLFFFLGDLGCFGFIRGFFGLAFGHTSSALSMGGYSPFFGFR